MNTQTQPNLINRSCLALGLALALWTPVQAQSSPAVPMQSMPDGKMMQSGQGMMEQMKKMMAEAKVQDADLAKLVAEMNRAPAAQKTALMAAIVTRLVEQRAGMNAHMMAMHEEMMQTMMGGDSMSTHPMMNDTDDKTKGMKK